MVIRERAPAFEIDEEEVAAFRVRSGESIEQAVVYHLDRWEKGEASPTADDNEPEDVDWINDASQPLAHAIAPRAAAELALSLAEEADRRVAALSSALVTANEAAGDPVHLGRWEHRRAHLDEIELALAR